jgi:hypothetical protein
VETNDQVEFVRTCRDLTNSRVHITPLTISVGPPLPLKIHCFVLTCHLVLFVSVVVSWACAASPDSELGLAREHLGILFGD